MRFKKIALALTLSVNIICQTIEFPQGSVSSPFHLHLGERARNNWDRINREHHPRRHLPQNPLPVRPDSNGVLQLSLEDGLEAEKKIEFRVSDDGALLIGGNNTLVKTTMAHDFRQYSVQRGLLAFNGSQDFVMAAQEETMSEIYILPLQQLLQSQSKKEKQFEGALVVQLAVSGLDTEPLENFP